MANIIRLPGAQDEALPTLTRVRNDRAGAYTLVHCTDDLDEAAEYGLWESVRWWYQNNAEFTLEVGTAEPHARGAGGRFPLMKTSRGHGRHQALHRRGHDHRRHR